MTVVPGVRADRTRALRLRAPGLTLAGLGAATLALQVRDPHRYGAWGHCPSLALFGVYCPGCGGLRAVNDLGHGDLGAAASSNLLLVVLLPVLVALLAGWTYAAWSGRPVAVPAPVARLLARRATTFGLVVAVLAFTVLRNLPVGAWLAP